MLLLFAILATVVFVMMCWAMHQMHFAHQINKDGEWEYNAPRQAIIGWVMVGLAVAELILLIVVGALLHNFAEALGLLLLAFVVAFGYLIGYLPQASHRRYQRTRGPSPF